MARAAKSKGATRVNFKGVETNKTLPEGDYPMTALSFTKGKSGNGNEQFELVAEVNAGENKGAKGYMYFPLAENSLWKLANFLVAIGIDVPDGELDIEESEVVGKDFVGIMTHETYNGKKRHKMTDVTSISEYSGDLPGDEKKSKKKGKDGKKKDKAAGKGDKSEKGGKKDKTPPAEEKSSKKDKSGKKGDKKPKVEKIDADDVKALDEKGLKKLIKQHDLDVDLGDYKTLKKQATAVCEALEEKDLLAD